MSAVRRLAVGTVATVARCGNSDAELELGDSGIGRSPCRGDRHDVGGQAEVFEDMYGGAGIGEEHEHAEGISAARALGDLVAEHPAQ